MLCYNRTGSIMLLLPKLFQFGHVSQTCVIFLYFLHQLTSTYPTWPTLCNLRNRVTRLSNVVQSAPIWACFPSIEHIWATCHNATTWYNVLSFYKIRNTSGAVCQFASIRHKMILLIQVFHVVQFAQLWQSFPNDCQTFLKRRGTLPNTRNWQNMLRNATKCYNVPQRESVF